MLLCSAIASHLGYAFYKKGPDALGICVHLEQITRRVGISYLIQHRGNGKFSFYYQKDDEVIPRNVDAVFAIYHETHYKNWFGRCKVWLQSKLLGKNAYIVKIKQNGQILCFGLNPTFGGVTICENLHKARGVIPKGDGGNMYVGVVTSKSWCTSIHAEASPDTTELINALYGVKHET